VIKWPGITKSGSVSDALISQVDLMATFAALVNFELPRNAAEDSHNFLPFLRGETPTAPRTALVHNTYPGQYAVRHGNWLLVDHKTGYQRQPPAEWMEKHKVPAEDEQPVELYDLKKDIGQRHNVAASYPEKVSELRALLKKLREQGHSAPRLEVKSGR
jgi:arylsulfatase A